MILAAGYIPSPLQLMLVAQETGIPIPPPGQVPGLFGKRGIHVTRFAGIGAIRPRTGIGGVPGAAGRGFPGLLSGRASVSAGPGRGGKLGLKLVPPPPMAVLPRGWEVP
jgi:hypothetical protein